MGNIGSELARAYHWSQKGDREKRNLCLARTFDLIDLTLSVKHRPPRLREIARMRELLADWYCDQKTYQFSPQDMIDYCSQFIFLAGK